MPNYDLNRLGANEFEHLCQSLLKEIIGDGVTIFGDGPDGAREATFNGKAPYPSPSEIWDGKWIFQAKFHNTQAARLDESRQQVLSDLKAELHKIVHKYAYQCDNYILITNVPLSSVPDRGTHDRITTEVLPEFLSAIPHIHVWGADDICRFLEKYSNVRRAYLHFVTPGDLIAELMQNRVGNSLSVAKTIQSYMTTSFSRERYAQLDQAGQGKEDRMPLQKVIIDLDVQFIHPRDLRRFFERDSSLFQEYLEEDQGGAFSAMQIMLSEKLPRTVIIGGPGEGKSTLGQYLAQIHRATLLNRRRELDEDKLDLTPLVARIPFRINLKDYAQWLSSAGNNDGLEFYICEQVKGRSSTSVSPDEIQEIFHRNPCLLILDGLDEVTDPGLQDKMLDRISEFLDRCEHVLEADLHVLATSRPASYSNQFDSSKFIHLQLVRLKPDKVLEYVDRWIQAKQIDDVNSRRLLRTIRECLSDNQIRLLMNTPLQVTILILIVLSGGTPPRQREALFHEYLEVIYKRESAKAVIQTNREELFELHEYLGYVLQKRASRAQDVRSLLEKTEFVKEVKKFLRSNDPFRAEELLDKKVEALVKEAEQRLVLIVEPEDNFFGFELRPIQEFFAAGHLVNTPKEDLRYGRFEAIARPAHWRNVALFFAGRIGRLRSAEAANIIDVCRHIDREKPDIFLKRGAWLALELAADRSFGHKRRLQWSVIEYGLTLLDAGDDVLRPHEILPILEKLPAEDITDIVLPVLKPRLSSLSPGQWSAIDLFHALDPTSEFLLEALEALICNSDQRYVVSGIRKGVEFRIDPVWMGSRLKDYCSGLPGKEFAAIFAPVGVSDPDYIRACLAHCSLDSEHVTTLLDRAFASAFQFVPSNQDKSLAANKAFYDISTTLNQMVSVFYILHFLRASMRQLHPPIPGRFAEAPSLPPIEMNVLSDQFRLILTGRPSDLLPHLAACMWLVLFMAKPNDTDYLGAFVSFYGDLKNRPRILTFLKKMGREVHPIMTVLLEAIEAGPEEVMASVNNLITNYGDRKNFARLENRVEQLLGGLPGRSIKLIKLFGLPILEDNIEKSKLEYMLKELLGASAEYLPQLFPPMPIPKKVELQQISLEAWQLSVVFDHMCKDLRHNADFEDLLQRARYLSWMQWRLDDRAMDQSASLLSQLLEWAEVSPVHIQGIASLLFLKLYDFGPPAEVIAAPVLRGLGKLPMSPSRISLVRPDPDLFNLIVTDLMRYLPDAEQEVQQGAVKLMMFLLENIYSSPPHMSERLWERFKVEVEFHTIDQMLDNPNQLIRNLGINLLPFYALSIERQNKRLFSMILACHENQEARAWSRFIQHLPLLEEPGQHARWKNFLESLLENELKVLPIVRRAALIRYSRLVASQDTADLIDELKLGLPLAHDN